MIDEKTINRDYPKPHPDNWMREDVERIRAAIHLIDLDIHGMLDAGISNGNIAPDAAIEQGKLNLNIGTGPNDLVQLNENGELPAVPGQNLIDAGAKTRFFGLKISENGNLVVYDSDDDGSYSVDDYAESFLAGSDTEVSIDPMGHLILTFS